MTEGNCLYLIVRTFGEESVSYCVAQAGLVYYSDPPASVSSVIVTVGIATVLVTFLLL